MLFDPDNDYDDVMTWRWTLQMTLKYITLIGIFFFVKKGSFGSFFFILRRIFRLYI